MLDISDLDVELAGPSQRPAARRDHEGRACVLAAVCELALERAAGVVGIGGRSRLAQRLHDGKRILSRLHRDEDIELWLFLSLQREDEPLDTRAESDPGRRWPADLFDEIV